MKTNRRLILGLIALGALLVLGLVLVRGAIALKRQPDATTAAPLIGAPRISETRLRALEARTQGATATADTWIALADAQLAKHSYAAAAQSYRKGLALDAERPASWSALGEAIIMSTPSKDSKMPPEARAAFNEATKRNPDDIRAYFYNTMEMDFAGRHEEAIGRWLAMAQILPRGSHESDMVRTAIAASIRRNQAMIERALNRSLTAAPPPKAGNGAPPTPAPAPAPLLAPAPTRPQ